MTIGRSVVLSFGTYSLLVNSGTAEHFRLLQLACEPAPREGLHPVRHRTDRDRGRGPAADPVAGA